MAGKVVHLRSNNKVNKKLCERKSNICDLKIKIIKTKSAFAIKSHVSGWVDGWINWSLSCFRIAYSNKIPGEVFVK